MKNLVITIALAASLSGSVAIPCALAQTPAPATAPAASNAADHARIEAALKQLNLAPRQKLQIAKIVRAAKANNQDKMTTMKQISQVLTPDQLAKLKSMLEASKAGGPPKPPQ